MVKIALQIKAILENIEELKPAGREFSWCLKFTCSNCGEVSQKWNDVSLSEEFPEQHGKAVSHFVNKCKMCSRSNSATILEDSIKSYGPDDNGEFKTIVAFDCRGMEPSSFWARNGWIAKTVDGGVTFNDVDLTDGDWADYCEKIKQPVSISEIEHKFVRVK